MTVFLLWVNVKQVHSEDFIKVKRFLALNMFLEALKDVLCMVVVMSGSDRFLLDYFVTPMIFFFQVYILTFSIIRLMHSNVHLKLRLWLFPIPVIVLFIFYFCSYLVYKGSEPMSVASYSGFIHTGAAKYSSLALIIMVGVAVLFSAVCLEGNIRRYVKGVGDYFSGWQEHTGMRIKNMVYLLLLYWTLDICDFFLAKSFSGIFLTCINSVLLMVFTLIMLNLQNIYVIMSPAFAENAEPEEAKAGEEETDVARPAVVASKPVGVENAHFEDIVHSWCNREDKPFLHEGLTLARAADEMGVTTRFLSGFLNDIYEMNFNSWINMLRVEEVKRLIGSGTDKSMSELAMMAGFTDLSAMSRIFKRLEGETPTQYRANIRNS